MREDAHRFDARRYCDARADALAAIAHAPMKA